MYYDYFLQWHATAQKDIQVGKFCGEASVNLSKAVFFRCVLVLGNVSNKIYFSVILNNRLICTIG